jgi:hypothetical protein
MNSITSDMKKFVRKECDDLIVEQKLPTDIANGTKIFIVGPPRSGTTLIYSMIAQELFLPECTFISTMMKIFDEMYKYSDDERFYYYGHNLTNLAEIFKKPIYDFLYTAATKSGGNLVNKYIYKDPILTLYLEYFHLFFYPSYKIVFCLRDPRDTVSSMFTVMKKQSNEMDDSTIFNKTINYIFPFYQKIYNLDKAIDKIDNDKIIFVKYECIVTGDNDTIRKLEKFLGFTINSQGVNESIKGKLDETSAFYSENYGKAITKKSMGGYKSILSSKQILETERVFSYYLDRLKY